MGLICLLLLTGIIYWPGLHGILLLDDSINLQGLAQIATPISWPQFAAFSFSGVAGGAGRPISLATFAVQYYAWPFDVATFRYMNVLVHLLNGCLIFWIVLELGRYDVCQLRRPHWVALLASSLWLLHPMQVSTVLYVVQRMTELAALFSLAGILAYLKARSLLLQNRTLTGLGGMSVAILVGTLFATLSKENGILLPLLLLSLEVTVLAGTVQSRAFQWWKWIALAGPMLILAAWFAWNFDWLIRNAYRTRDFSLEERLLTELRVLWDYLGNFFYPTNQGFGPFHDDFKVSRGWLSPPSTFLSAIGWLVAGFLTIRFRHSVPFLSLALMWFLAAHLLESSFIPLEIYFEHRNYLPLVGICIGIAYLLINSLSVPASPTILKMLHIVLFMLPIILALLTLQETKLWGQPASQALLWAQQHPNSLRAQELLAEIYSRSGYGLKAAEVYRNMWRIAPSDARTDSYMLHLSCHYPEVKLPTVAESVSRLRDSNYSIGALSGLDAILSLKEQGHCASVAPDTLLKLIKALLGNPRFSARHANLYFMLGRLYAISHNLSGAVAALEQAYVLQPRVETALLQATWAAELGKCSDAKRHINKALALNSQNSALRREAYNNIISDLQKTNLCHSEPARTAR